MGFSDAWQMARGLKPPKPTFTPDIYPDLTGKVVLVTGANTGVGLQAARLLASKNAKVYTLARKAQVMEERIAEIKKEFPNAQLIPFICDFSDLTTIKPAVENFLKTETRLDIVLHNAGVGAPPKGSTSAQGHELQVAVNNLAPYLLQKLLDPIMFETEKTLTGKKNTSRLVWVSSAGQYLAPENGFRKDSIDDLNAGPGENYAQTKACMIVLAAQWAKKHPESNIISVAVDPGSLRSEFHRHFKSFAAWVTDFFLFPAIMGAYSELYPALSPDLTTADNGKLTIPWGRFGKARKDIADASVNELGDGFWDFCEKSTKPYQ